MENAADALKMAAAILIFIIAIASSFSLFGTAKQTADSIIGMRDKQAYLEAADLEGVLYTTSSSVKSDGTKFTDKGDRIVDVSDVISTIYRYSKEKYGVTIVDSKGNVKARFDSNTENIMRQYYNNIEYEKFYNYIYKLKDNTENDYVEVKYASYSMTNNNTLYNLYRVTTKGNKTIQCGAPWYGNDEEIQKRINADISGEDYTYNGQTYKGKGLLDLLKNKRIVEVTNEIDQSKYLQDGDSSTNLLQQYEMPTVEIIYIIL